MPAQVTNYKCPACTGPLQFSAETGKMECEFCGSSFPVAEIEAMYAEKNEKAAQAQADAQQKAEASAAENEAWDTSGLNDDWGEDADGMRVYNCPSCGAELICEETTAATSCPYCDNPTVIPGQFGGTLKPDYVIPFKKTKEDAKAALQEHYKGRPFLPKVFKDAGKLEEIKGVYVPFWLFDGEAEGDVRFNAKKIRSYRSGDYEITETKHYDVARAGSIEFSRIPVDGSKKMPDDYMDSLEPFNYDEMTEFSTSYLPGFMADKYDVTAEECSPRADLRANNSLADCLRSTVNGYSTVSETWRNIVLHRGAVKYAFLPVWLLNIGWNNEKYLFAMNGQTGKMVGKLPIDKKKRTLTAIGVYLLAFLLTLAGTMAYDGLSSNFSVGALVLAPILIAAIVIMILNAKMKSVAPAVHASEYISTELNLTMKQDVYTHTTRTQRRIERRDK